VKKSCFSHLKLWGHYYNIHNIGTGYLCGRKIGGNMRKVAHAINQPTINFYEINLPTQLQSIG
jgi:hypothetical protein